MTNRNDKVNLGKSSLVFLVITIGMILISLLVAWTIIMLNGSFTYWAVVPLLFGLPLTMIINVQLAKRTVAKTQRTLSERGIDNENLK